MSMKFWLTILLVLASLWLALVAYNLAHAQTLPVDPPPAVTATPYPPIIPPTPQPWRGKCDIFLPIVRS